MYTSKKHKHRRFLYRTIHRPHTQSLYRCSTDNLLLVFCRCTELQSSLQGSFHKRVVWYRDTQTSFFLPSTLLICILDELLHKADQNWSQLAMNKTNCNLNRGLRTDFHHEVMIQKQVWLHVSYHHFMGNESILGVCVQPPWCAAMVFFWWEGGQVGVSTLRLVGKKHIFDGQFEAEVYGTFVFFDLICSFDSFDL